MHIRYITTVKCYIKSSKCHQEYVNSLLRMLSKSAMFLDFKLQGSVATYYRWGGNLFGVYTGNFPTNQLVKEFWKSVHICQSYYQTPRCILFWDTVYSLYPTYHEQLDSSRPPAVIWCPSSIVCIMNLPALRAISFLWASPYWHRNELAHTHSVLD